MKTRRWMEKVLEESKKEQIEMPWSRTKRNSARMALKAAKSA